MFQLELLWFEFLIRIVAVSIHTVTLAPSVYWR
jgi:hypothetical protein